MSAWKPPPASVGALPIPTSEKPLHVPMQLQHHLHPPVCMCSVTSSFLWDLTCACGSRPPGGCACPSPTSWAPPPHLHIQDSATSTTHPVRSGVRDLGLTCTCGSRPPGGRTCRRPRTRAACAAQRPAAAPPVARPPPAGGRVVVEGVEVLQKAMVYRTAEVYQMAAALSRGDGATMVVAACRSRRSTMRHMHGSVHTHRPATLAELLQDPSMHPAARWNRNTEENRENSRRRLPAPAARPPRGR